MRPASRYNDHIEVMTDTQTHRHTDSKSTYRLGPSGRMGRVKTNNFAFFILPRRKGCLMDRTLLGTLLLCFFFTIRHLRKHITCMLLSCDPTQATCFAHVAEISKATHFTQSPPLSKVYPFAVSLYSYQPSSYDKRVTS